MSRIYIGGIGAVSPAGWNVPALRAALEKNEPLPAQTLARPGWEKPLHVRQVPPPATRPEFLAHPRLRRSSPITHYAASASVEALAGLRAHPGAKDFRLGVIACLQTGCVQYSCRFYDETLKNPATASPLVFPETVHAAPTSHVAALLENVALTTTLVGDPSIFLQGIALGTQWLADNRADACLVFGADETNWIIADAFAHLDRQAVATAGAGALCLCRDEMLSTGVELAAITDAQVYSARQTRLQAAQAMRAQLGDIPDGELLCDGLGGSRRADAAEHAAFADCTNPRVSPKRIFGEGMMAAAAWQCVAACDALAERKFSSASVSLVGPSQQAVGARFVRAESGLSTAATAGNIRA
jgi:3-oxoacyl-(acyl-carrier-protein) synthase